MDSSIPLWVGGRLMLITELTEHSSCRDVIVSILKFQFEVWKFKKPENYRIIERWRRVERHLPARCRVLKVWRAWGNERRHVKFLLKRDRQRRHIAGRRSPMVFGPSCMKHSSKFKMHKTRFGFPGRFKPLGTGDIDKLKEIVATQREILANQVLKISDKDEEIDRYESMIHLHRVKEVGENYLQDAYLGDEEQDTEQDTGDEDGGFKSWSEGPSSRGVVQEAAKLYEKILEISRRIEKQEDYIRVLSSQIRHSVSIQDTSEKDDGLDLTALFSSSDENLDAYLYKTKIRIECLLALNRSQKLAIAHNERMLQEYNRIYEHKGTYLQQLERDLLEADCDTKRIAVSHTNSINSSPENGRFSSQTNGDAGFVDNNSDTGLSSLHSSGDENGYTLDTLV